MYEFYARHYEESILLYDTAFSYVESPAPYDQLKLAFAYYYLNDYDNSLNAIKKLEGSYINIDFMIQYYSLDSLFNSEKGRLIRANLQPNATFFNDNIGFYSDIQKMYELDQYIRDKAVQNINDEEKKAIFDKLVYEVDSVNMVNLIEIFENPKFSLRKIRYFENAFNNINSLLLHGTTHNEFAFDFFVKRLKEEIYKGDFSAFGYAQFIDRKLLSENQVQKYGGYNVEGKFFSKIKDVDKVDSLRINLGLPTLSEMSKKLGYPIPEGYAPTKNVLNYLNCNE